MMNMVFGQRSERRRYRGSYISAHVLLNLLKDLRKRDKLQDLPSILSLFPNELNKFNNTRAGIIDSIYHMTFVLFEVSFLPLKNFIIFS